jgi:dolichol-phosphate mannosyltransferase
MNGNIELTVVIPTFNEQKNVGPLVDLLKETLQGVNWEAVFVDDDSKDGTGETLIQMGKMDPRVRCLRRVGRRGLSSACIEGMMATGAPFIAVMDADLQHDHTLLPKMLSTIKEKNVDFVVGSRYMQGGSLGEWGAARRFVSKAATKLGLFVLRMDLTDPMSGFFVVRRAFFETVVRKLSGKGFKILVDIVSSAPKGTQFAELPFTFRTRNEGESKLGTLVAWDYFFLIAEKSLGRFIPIRFLMFVLVGSIGAAAHVLALGLLMKQAGIGFLRSQAIATLIAMTVNFTLNNVFSYRDQQLKGKKFILGLVTFYFACALGAVINLQIARSLFGAGIVWWLSGLLGAMVGAVWNFAITSTFTWKRRR